MFKDLTEFLYIGFEFNLRFNHVFLDWYVELIDRDLEGCIDELKGNEK